MCRLIDGKIVPSNGPDRVVAELLVRERNLLRTIIAGDWKYIAAYRWLPPEERPRASAVEQQLREHLSGTPFDPWGEIVSEELYRLSDDPAEEINLADRFGDKLEEFRYQLLQYRRYSEQSGARLHDVPQSEGPLTPEQEERLKALGYL